jgi:hypothetical protein
MKVKLFIYPIFYWIIFFILPFKIIFPLIIKDGGWIALYLLILPLIFFLPYKLAKLEIKKEKFYFITFGFIIPLVIFYYYLFLKFKEGFHPGF